MHSSLTAKRPHNSVLNESRRDRWRTSSNEIAVTTANVVAAVVVEVAEDEATMAATTSAEGLATTVTTTATSQNEFFAREMGATSANTTVGETSNGMTAKLPATTATKIAMIVMTPVIEVVVAVAVVVVTMNVVTATIVTTAGVKIATKTQTAHLAPSSGTAMSATTIAVMTKSPVKAEATATEVVAAYTVVVVEDVVETTRLGPVIN